MLVKELMTADPACCSPEASLQKVAQQMASNDCGEIPVLDEERRPIGVITDRDICVRAVAKGKDAQTQVREIMSRDIVTVSPEENIDICFDLMEQHMIRRLPVVDEDGVCCGMITQADLARKAAEEETGDMLRRVSQPNQDGPYLRH